MSKLVQRALAEHITETGEMWAIREAAQHAFEAMTDSRDLTAD